MRPFPRLPLLAAGLLALTACEEERITLDAGTPSSVEVRAYVDANGNGTFDPGDQPVTGATVTATGPMDATATTDEAGLAILDGLIPGDYTLSLSGDIPQGAVLATASNPVVVAPFQGGDLQAEFRYSFFPGSVTGRLWREEDGNGEFDEEVDLPAAGIPVEIYEGGEAAGEPLTTTTTDAEGFFAFQGLRPGSYTVQVQAPETIEIAGGAVRTVDVTAQGEQFLPLIFEGTLVMDIADARSAPTGQTVTVQGSIGWAPGFDDATLFLQDETGGISVFDFNLPEGLEEGDRVEITGTRGAFRGEVQISPVSNIEVLGPGATPLPRPVTADEVNEGLFQGQVVSIDGTVLSVTIPSFDNQRVILEDAEGEQFAVYVDGRTGVGPDTWEVGEVYGVSGVLGTDDRDDLEHRVEVRFPSDVQPGGATVDIADARAAVGSPVVVQGVITWAPSFDDRVLFLQDATGGIAVFDFDLPDGLARGDLVRIRATVGEFGGEVQLEDVEELEVLGSVTVPSPRGVSGAQINEGLFQGELVTVTGEVVEVTNPSFDNQLVTVEDDAGTQFPVYSDGRTGVQMEDWTVGERIRVTGVLGSSSDTPRLEIRGAEDMESLAAGEVSIAEARSRMGETVTVTGTVTRTPGWDDRIAFIQDASAGIGLFFSGLPEVGPGDRLQVTGEITEFNGELQIAPESATVVGQADVPDPTPVTGAQVNAGLFQGQLVQASGTVVSVEIVNSFGTQEVTVQDADGTQFRVFSDNRTGLAEEDWTVGEEVTVAGILGFFDGNDPGAQLEVMQSDDVVFGS